MSKPTCKTFLTPREALAFIMGFHAAASEDILVHIDADEAQTVLADFNDDEAEGVWLKAALEFNKAAEKFPNKPITCKWCGWDFLILSDIPDTDLYRNTDWCCPHCTHSTATGPNDKKPKALKKSQPTAIQAAHDALSAALENPDAGNDAVRDAAIAMCDALNQSHFDAKFPHFNQKGKK